MSLFFNTLITVLKKIHSEHTVMGKAVRSAFKGACFMATEQLNSFFDELGFKNTLELIYKEIQELFLENTFPWVIGYSGGKDSTAVLQLIWLALEKLPAEQRMSKKVYVITTDTLVENPVVAKWVDRSLDLMRTQAQQTSMPIEPHSLKPKHKNSFWVNLLGKGYPAPRAKFSTLGNPPAMPGD